MASDISRQGWPPEGRSFRGGKPHGPLQTAGEQGHTGDAHCRGSRRAQSVHAEDSTQGIGGMRSSCSGRRRYRLLADAQAIHGGNRGEEAYASCQDRHRDTICAEAYQGRQYERPDQGGEASETRAAAVSEASGRDAASRRQGSDLPRPQGGRNPQGVRLRTYVRMRPPWQLQGRHAQKTLPHGV